MRDHRADDDRSDEATEQALRAAIAAARPPVAAASDEVVLARLTAGARERLGRGRTARAGTRAAALGLVVALAATAVWWTARPAPVTLAPLAAVPVGPPDTTPPAASAAAAANPALPLEPSPAAAYDPPPDAASVVAARAALAAYAPGWRASARWSGVESPLAEIGWLAPGARAPLPTTTHVTWSR